jgi:hypothetical protein
MYKIKRESQKLGDKTNKQKKKKRANDKKSQNHTQDFFFSSSSFPLSLSEKKENKSQNSF